MSRLVGRGASVTVRIVGTTTLALALVIGGASLYNAKRTQRDFETKITALTGLISNTAPSLAAARDVTTLAYLLESMKRDPDFAGALVGDDFSGTLAAVTWLRKSSRNL